MARSKKRLSSSGPFSPFSAVDLTRCDYNPRKVADQPRSSLPWMLVAASVLFLAITLYLFFGAYLPAKQRLARLELELKQVYAREAQLQTRLAQQDKLYALRQQQATALTTERDALAKRIEELEKELGARGRGAPKR